MLCNSTVVCCDLLLQTHFVSLIYYIFIEKTFSNDFCFDIAYIQGLKYGDKLLINGAISILIIWLPMFHLLSNFGEDVIGAFVELNDEIFHMSWYLCPVNLQRYIVVMAAMAEKPVLMRGFATLNCSRQTFKQVGK